MTGHDFNRTVRRCIGMLPWLFVLAAAAQLARAAEDFVVVNEPVEIPERGKVMGHCIIANGQRFSFIPPYEWRMESNRSEQSVTFTRRTLDTAVRIRLLPPHGEGEEPDEERWQRLVKSRYPDAEIIRQFVCHTGSHSGIAFDLRQDFGGNLQLQSRVAFVAHPKGVLEIGQSGLAGTAEPSYEEFGTLLTSLRISGQTAGK